MSLEKAYPSSKFQETVSNYILKNRVRHALPCDELHVLAIMLALLECNNLSNKLLSLSKE